MQKHTNRSKVLLSQYIIVSVSVCSNNKSSICDFWVTSTISLECTAGEEVSFFNAFLFVAFKGRRSKLLFVCLEGTTSILHRSSERVTISWKKISFCFHLFSFHALVLDPMRLFFFTNILASVMRLCLKVKWKDFCNFGFNHLLVTLENCPSLQMTVMVTYNDWPSACHFYWRHFY